MSDDIVWVSVETPSVFKEYAVPADPTKFTREDTKRIMELEDLAERHGTIVRSTGYQRG